MQYTFSLYIPRPNQVCVYFLNSLKIFLCFPNVSCLTIDASRCPQVVVAGWTGRAGRQDPHLCSDPGQGRHGAPPLHSPAEIIGMDNESRTKDYVD